MIRCSILENNNMITNTLYKEVRERLECIFECEFMTSDPNETDLEISDIGHLFPNLFTRYKSKKELLDIILEVRDILTDDVIRKQLSPLYIYILYTLNERFFELQREMIDSGDIQESELIPQNIKKILSSNELSQDEKDSIEFWFTDGLEDDIYNYYDYYNLDDYVHFGWNDFAGIAQHFLDSDEINEESFEALKDGMCFVPKDIADLCLKKINKGNFSLIKAYCKKSDIKTKIDFFISYASDEKAIALELAKQLEALGATTWIDKKNIKIGDPIKLSIEKGILNSKFAVIILSENYLNKFWTNNELNALFEVEENGHKKILPLMYNLSHEKLKEKSIMLANRLCLSIDENSIAKIAKQIMEDISF